MKRNNEIQKRLIRRYFYWRTLPFMCFLLLWNVYGDFKGLSWSNLALFGIQLLVAVGLAYFLAISMSQIKLKYPTKNIIRD
ncbi:hypothetical protein [uncultured Sanguibacteroides sp.]|uniref:hypothetical protein n=1 Tax=uncultured Sanguibacteroides sp. TaxID=1635151 RepID=UPI0025E9628F|nr:hypothetical protein [uncultured Sanguibacteroides sp.]